ncbi:MAG: Holliday junction resolvase RuvX [Clostridia bacterium]|nr:Holliday junction resolvase RuvX [Clostridia bacterium]NCC75041.1 Holliday junction resolvase RuvX [Clostridia bacterium]
MTSTKPERYLAIDYGDARIGTAVSDPLGITARGLETINWNGRDWSWALDRLTALIEDLQITTVIMGLPRRTDGKTSETETKARAMGEELVARTGRPVLYRDERYTTVLASRVLRETGVRGQKRKAVVDQMAAEIILQEYLESRRKA